MFKLNLDDGHNFYLLKILAVMEKSVQRGERKLVQWRLSEVVAQIFWTKIYSPLVIYKA